MIKQNIICISGACFDGNDVNTCVSAVCTAMIYSSLSFLLSYLLPICFCMRVYFVHDVITITGTM